jgi:hypothetical protein
MKMKRQILISLILLSSVWTMNAQIYTPNGIIQGSSNNNNIGIGAASPSEKLQIGNFNNNENLKLSLPGSYNFEQIKMGQYGNGACGLELINHKDGINSYGVRFYSNVDYGMWGLQIQTANPTNAYENLNYVTRFAINTDGRIGIGTITPSASLHIRTSTADFLVENSGLEGAYMTVHSGRFNRPATTIYKQAGTEYWHTGILYDEAGNQKYSIGTANTFSSSKLTIQSDGNIGIATNDPQAKLQIGNLTGADKRIMIPGAYNFERLNLTMGANGNGELEFVTHSNGESSGGVKLYSPDGAHLYFQTALATTSYSSLNYQTKMTLTNGGYLGIGTTCPQTALDVAGTIRAKEVKVELFSGCDFVFKEDYKLMELKELEQFVKTNQHLPEVAPEKEMVENGVNMKELQMKLLQKIEELTLYTIEQNKKIETIQEQNELLKQEIELLKKK